MLGGVTSLLLLAALALGLHTGSYRHLLYVLSGSVLTLIGVLLTTRKPEQPIAWGFAGTALLWAIGAGAYAYAYEALVADPGSLPGGLAAAWVDNWFWLPTLVLPVSLLLLVVPDGRLLTPSWRPVLVAVLGGTALASAAVSGSSTFELGSEPIDNPLALDTTAMHIAAAIGFAIVAGAVVASLVSFALRYRRSLGEERQQLRWIGGSLGIGACFGAVGALTWGVFPYAYVLHTIAMLVLPVGTAVAILKYRLYEIELVVNRAFVYGVLTVCVVTSYVLVVGLAGATLSHRGDLVLSLALTGVVAVCFQPLRERVQRFVNKLMYGSGTIPTPRSPASAAGSRPRSGRTPCCPRQSRRLARRCDSSTLRSPSRAVTRSQRPTARPTPLDSSSHSCIKALPSESSDSHQGRVSSYVRQTVD